MSGLKHDLLGRRFGKLLVIERAPNRGKGGPTMWVCECDCGSIKTIQSSSLVRGDSKSCGCSRHRMVGTPIYRVWSNMVQRCTNSNNPAWEDYGGRGICVSDPWLTFENFYSDMGDIPDGMSLDRIDVNGDYCKENCRWTDRSTQNYNQRMKKSNKSGRTGICWNENYNTWTASWRENGRQVGRNFKTFQEALECREQAELRLYGEIKENFPIQKEEI